MGRPRESLAESSPRAEETGLVARKDSYGNVNFQKQVQWYLTLDGLLQDLMELGERDEELAVQVFNPSTIREIVNLFQ